MEPFSYFLGLGGNLLAYLYFVWNSQETSYQQMFDLSVKKIKEKLYVKNNFNLKEYEKLQNDVKDLEEQLVVIESRA